MKVFLSHTSADQDLVKAVGSFLQRHGIDVWIDDWQLTAGDSLVEKIGEALGSADRMVVFLSPASMQSSWVRRELAVGIVTEVAKKNGGGDKFVLPVILAHCEIPILLRDSFYVDFTTTSFEGACLELLKGITDSPGKPELSDVSNGIIRIHHPSAQSSHKYALIVEFAVRISPTEGLHIGIDFDSPFQAITEWFGTPNTPTPPRSTGGVYTQSSIRSEPPIYARKFSSPGVTSTRSFYVLAEGSISLRVKEILFRDFFDRKVLQ